MRGCAVEDSLPSTLLLTMLQLVLHRGCADLLILCTSPEKRMPG